MLLDDVIRTIDRHTMFSPGQRVGLAVSGGADSVCLLHLLHRLAPRWNLHLSVVHIEHGIRGAASIEDAEFVRDLAGSFALPFLIRQIDVPAIRDNLEQAARRVRQNFYQELIRGGVLDRVATGHTRSDQAETVLYRLLRGSGTTGLAGIRPVSSDGIVRPLLEITREQVREWLRSEGITWREDETNLNISYCRNRIRHELLPLLRERYNPQVDMTLAHLAELARDEEDYWHRLNLQVRAEEPLCYLQVTDVNAHAAIGRRLVRRAIEAVKGDLRQIDFQHVETVLAMSKATEGHGRTQIPGVDVFRSFNWIRFAPAGYDRGRERDFALGVTPPVRLNVPGTSTEISFQITDLECTSSSVARYDSLVQELDWQKTIQKAGLGPLELRNWRPGDHYRPAGQANEQKIKLLFQERRIPLWERRSWPVLTADAKIVWCRGFGPAADVAADHSSKAILHIRDSYRSGS